MTLGASDLSPTLTAEFAAERRRVEAEILKPRSLDTRMVLLVGGAGYIGIPLTQHFLECGYRVRCLDVLCYENGSCVTGFLGHPRYEFVSGDHGDVNAAAQALKGVTDVILLAGLVGDPITKRFPDAHRAINEVGLARFVEGLAGRSLNKVVFVSTCSNYGEIPLDQTADENYPLKPLSLYAEAKVAREIQLLALRDKADFCGTVLRFATAFGLSGRMRFDLTVSEFTRNLHAGESLEVYDADTWRPYCHVRDFARALTRVLEAPRERVYFDVFNAGGEANNFTKKMIVESVRARVPSGRVEFVAGGADRRNYRVDFSKIRERLEFAPLYTVEDGIRELVAALDQGFFADYDERPFFYRNERIRYNGF